MVAARPIGNERRAFVGDARRLVGRGSRRAAVEDVESRSRTGEAWNVAVRSTGAARSERAPAAGDAWLGRQRSSPSRLLGTSGRTGVARRRRPCPAAPNWRTTAPTERTGGAGADRRACRPQRECRPLKRFSRSRTLHLRQSRGHPPCRRQKWTVSARTPNPVQRRRSTHVGGQRMSRPALRCGNSPTRCSQGRSASKNPPPSSASTGPACRGASLEKRYGPSVFKEAGASRAGSSWVRTCFPA